MVLSEIQTWCQDTWTPGLTPPSRAARGLSVWRPLRWQWWNHTAGLFPLPGHTNTLSNINSLTSYWCCMRCAETHSGKFPEEKFELVRLLHHPVGALLPLIRVLKCDTLLHDGFQILHHHASMSFTSHFLFHTQHLYYKKCWAHFKIILMYFTTLKHYHII